MLRGIDPILPPDLLHILRAMGHGDEIALVDANFPAEANARRLVRCDGVNATDLLSAVVKILPLDAYSEYAAFSMQVVGDPFTTPEIVDEFASTISTYADHKTKIKPTERFAFYEAAKNSFAIVVTSERRLYGNIILKKGVIGGG